MRIDELPDLGDPENGDLVPVQRGAGAGHIDLQALLDLIAAGGGGGGGGSVDPALTGVAGGAVNLGAFSSASVPDNATIKAVFEALGGVVDTNKSDLASTAAGKGAELVGFKQAGTGAVVRHALAKAREIVSVMDFGAASDGVTDDTAAWNLAIAWLNVGGSKTLLVPGHSKITATLDPITADHAYIVGQSDGGSSLLLSATGEVFTFTGYGGGFRDILFSYPAAPAAGAIVYLADGGNGQSILACRINNVRTLAKMGTGASSGYALTVTNLRGNVYNGGSPLFNLVKGAGLFISDPKVYVAGVGVPTTNRTSTMTSVSGTNFINAGGSYTWDVIQITGAGILERWYRILNFNTSGAGDLVLNTFVSPTIICDYIADSPYYFNAAAGTGGILDVQVEGYANSWDGSTLTIAGAGLVRDVRINLVSAVSGEHSILINNASATHIKVTGGQYIGANRKNLGAHGITMAAGNNIEVTDCDVGYSGAYGGFNWQAHFGVSVAADISSFAITNVDAAGATAAFDDFTGNTTASGDRIMRGNRGANYAGFKTTGIYVIPATTVPWVNKTPFDIEVTISGGTVTAIQKTAGGSPITTGLIAGTFTIRPGHSITLTYSVAPTMLFDVAP